MSNSYNLGVNVWFNNNWINSVTGLLLVSVNPYAPPRRILNTATIARAEKVTVSSAFYNQKMVFVKAAISRPGRELMEQSIDELSAMLHGKEKYLVIMQSGASRRYLATLDGIETTEAKGGHCMLTIRFACSDIFGYDVAYSTLINLSALTAATRNENITVAGSAPWQLPVITVTYTALSGGTSKTVTIGNNNTGQAITVTRTWATNDILEIDSLNRTVKVNGIEVTYSGAFPELALGSGQIGYFDNLTTRTFNYNVKYYKRYA